MSKSIDPRTRAFAIERARTRLKGDRLVVGEPVLLDDELWWVVRDDGGSTLSVRSDNGHRAKLIARWQTRSAGRIDRRALEADPTSGPALPASPAAAPGVDAARTGGRTYARDPWDLSSVPQQQSPTPESTLAWLREVRDRFPGSPLEEWVLLAETRNHRMKTGRWPPKEDET
jgi:hypothetical protein